MATSARLAHFRSSMLYDDDMPDEATISPVHSFAADVKLSP
ncbi:hypothetical protein [Actibacterium pelagium]|nr:hypothetical protein [Actibacterium pelagium]